MKLQNRTMLRLLAGLALFVSASAVQAQATRTWVSGVGDDVNPCSRTAPCKTFAGAISKTAAGGTINVLDPGGFGGVTIVKSITIDGLGIQGGILSSAGANGIVVNLPSANDIVVLRNLTLNGAGTALNGIRMVGGGTLHVENVQVQDYRAAGGHGLSIQPSLAGVHRLHVRNSDIVANGAIGSTGGGILLSPTGTATLMATIEDTHVTGNRGFGIKSTDRVFATVAGSRINGNTGSGINLTTTASLSETMVRDSVIDANGIGSVSDAGIFATGTNSTARLSHNVISNNDRGINRTNFGKAFSTGDNAMLGNTTDGTVNGPDVSL